MSKVVLAAIVVAMLLVPAGRAGTLDALQKTHDADAISHDDVVLRLAQTFLVSRSGNLDQVDLKIDNGPTPQMGGVGASARVDVYATVGGVPTVLLGTGTVNPSPVFMPGMYFRSATITPAIPVTAGTTYAIVVTAPAVPGGPGGYRWAASSTNTYAAGAAYQSANGAAWAPVPGVADFTFKTYVKLTAEDQAHEVDNFQTVVRDNTTFQGAQTFTAGKTGTLNRVDVKLSQYTPAFTPTAPVTVQIRNVSGGSPGSTVLATTTIPIASVPNPQAGEVAAFVPAQFAPGAAVTSGTQYALVLSTAGSGGYLWQQGNPGSYTGGGAFSGNGTSWGAQANIDFDFRTYVGAPTAVEVASATAIRTSRGVLVRWRTPAVVGAVGFDVFREVNGVRAKANSRLLVASPLGVYSFLDRAAPRGKALRYWVRLVRADGSRSWHSAGSVTR